MVDSIDLISKQEALDADLKAIQYYFTGIYIMLEMPEYFLFSEM